MEQENREYNIKNVVKTNLKTWIKVYVIMCLVSWLLLPLSLPFWITYGIKGKLKFKDVMRLLAYMYTMPLKSAKIAYEDELDMLLTK